MSKLTIAYERLIAVTKSYLKSNFNRQVHQALFHNRTMFRDFLKSLSARQSSKQERLFEKIDLKLLKQTFPIWLVNMADVHNALPLQKEFFDLAIIDEASQCDIASCLPIIQRAKRVVIVGDPKQLKHVSFLSRSAQMALEEKNGIVRGPAEIYTDYRNTSILDLVNDRITNQEQVCFLNEHFRSQPQIIAFSNKAFLQG